MGTQPPTSWKILLIGDHCRDIFHYGVCERLNPEAPVPVLKVLSKKIKQGMSSNVRLNMESLGLHVDHHHNNEMIEKHRLIDRRFNHHLLRYDLGEDTVLAEFDVKKIKHEDYDAVVISDYNKGFVRYDTALKICEKFPDTPIFVDTKKKDLSCYQGCYIKINEKEFKLLKTEPKKSKFIVTLGEDGALYEGEVYSTEATEVFDVVGAGDVFLASLVYGYLNSGDMKAAIKIANKAATFSVSKIGTYVLTRKDVHDLRI